MHVDQEAIAAKSELDRMRRLLKSLDVNNMTPMEALAMIARLQGEV